jgi:pyruvate carboxylase
MSIGGAVHFAGCEMGFRKIANGECEFYKALLDLHPMKSSSSQPSSPLIPTVSVAGKKLLAANRSEIAIRVFRAATELGMRTVAIYAQEDRHTMHRFKADEAYVVGEGKGPVGAYLDIDGIISLAREHGVDMIHPGYGFLSENAAFARACVEAGITFVGPDSELLDTMGDKTAARALAQKLNVPTLPGTEDPVSDRGEALRIAKEMGFPLIIKAAFGGGGRGMRVVTRSEDLVDLLDEAQGEAERAFGNTAVFLEKYIPRAKHIEVQILGDRHGNVLHLHERDCSVQRRFQKVIEESPAPGLPAATREAMCEAAAALARAQRYRGAGTVEFVVDADGGEFYFLEMNTRIQVEHPVTEMNTGVDLVAMQLQLAAGAPGGPVRQHDVRPSGHAIEARLYAERPARGFLPATGTLARFDLPPAATDLRVDCGVRAGDAITHWYDPMIAKVIAHGATREAAAERLLEGLAAIAIEG